MKTNLINEEITRISEMMGVSPKLLKEQNIAKYLLSIAGELESRIGTKAYGEIEGVLSRAFRSAANIVDRAGVKFLASESGNFVPMTELERLIDDVSKGKVQPGEELEKRLLKIPRKLVDGTELREPLSIELEFIAGRKSSAGSSGSVGKPTVGGSGKSVPSGEAELPPITVRSAPSKETKMLFNIMDDAKNYLDADEMNFLNSISKRISDDSTIAKLTPQERLEANYYLQKLSKSLDDAVQTLKKDAEQLSGQKKIKMEQRIQGVQDASNALGKGIKATASVITLRNALRVLGIATASFTVYLGYGFISGMCDKPIISWMCDEANKHLFDKDKKKKEEEPEEDGEEGGGGSLTPDQY